MGRKNSNARSSIKKRKETKKLLRELKTKERKPNENDKKSKFRKEIKVLPETPQASQEAKSRNELSQFVTTVTQLTGNFEDDLYDVMVMYSNRKGSARFQSIEEYQKYQRMYEQLSFLLDKNKGNYLKSYSELIEKYPKDSDESLIIKTRINRLIEKEKQNEGR